MARVDLVDFKTNKKRTSAEQKQGFGCPLLGGETGFNLYTFFIS